MKQFPFKFKDRDREDSWQEQMMVHEDVMHFYSGSGGHQTMQNNVLIPARPAMNEEFARRLNDLQQEIDKQHRGSAVTPQEVAKAVKLLGGIIKDG